MKSVSFTRNYRPESYKLTLFLQCHIMVLVCKSLFFLISSEINLTTKIILSFSKVGWLPEWSQDNLGLFKTINILKGLIIEWKRHAFESSIVCKKYLKNCTSWEKAVTTSETLTEYTIRSCTTIASNNCRLKTHDLRKLGNSDEKKWKAQTTA